MTPVWRNLRLQQKTAFLRFPPVHRANLDGRLWVDLTPSPRRWGMTAFCDCGHRASTRVVPHMEEVTAIAAS